MCRHLLWGFSWILIFGLLNYTASDKTLQRQISDEMQASSRSSVCSFGQKTQSSWKGSVNIEKCSLLCVLYYLLSPQKQCCMAFAADICVRKIFLFWLSEKNKVVILEIFSLQPFKARWFSLVQKTCLSIQGSSDPDISDCFWTEIINFSKLGCMEPPVGWRRRSVYEDLLRLLTGKNCTSSAFWQSNTCGIYS